MVEVRYQGLTDSSVRAPAGPTLLASLASLGVAVIDADADAKREPLDDTVFILAGDAQRRRAYRAALAAQITAAGMDEGGTACACQFDSCGVRCKRTLYSILYWPDLPVPCRGYQPTLSCV